MDQIFPGQPSSVGDFRRFVAAALTSAQLPTGVVENSRLVASELATNALEHSRSALEGGKYVGKVEIGIDAVLIEVVDEGAEDGSGPEVLAAPGNAEGGRGLWLCAAFGLLSTETTADGSRRTAVRLPLGVSG